MPTTRRQKKSRKSRDIDVLSDMVNLDIILGGNNLEVKKVNLTTLAEGPIVRVTTLQ